MPTLKYKDPADGLWKVLSTAGVPGSDGPPGPTGPAGPAGSAFIRTTASVTTASLAPAAVAQGTITLATAYRLYALTTSRPARVRLYSTTAKRSADLARPIGTDPVGDHGQMLEFVSTASVLSADLSPTVDGFDGKVTPDGAIPYSITNLDSATGTITVGFTFIRTE